MRWNLDHGWRGHAVAAIAGALVTLSLAPFNLWPAAIISTAVLAGLLNNLTPRQGAVRGWFFGAGLMGSGSSWVYVSIHVYGYAPVPLASFLTILYCGGIALTHSLFCYAYCRWIKPQPAGTTLGFAAIWVLCEWFRSWFLTGFPWLYIGYGHLESPLAGWAPIGGVFAISFIVALTGAVITQLVSTQPVKLSITAVITLLLWLAGGLLTTIDWVQPKDRQAIRVAMVQANISQAIKWRPDNYWPTLNLYNSMSRPLWPDADLVVWPEAAIPNYYHNAKNFLDRMAQMASENDAALITGIPYRSDQDSGERYNSIVALGNGSGVYHKQKLVPFGEYVPFENILKDLLQFFELPMSAMSAGSANQQGLKINGYRLAPFICYEIVYPDLVADWLPDHDLLITISNDAWFGTSLGPLQHLQMAQMRALENGRYLIRSTGSGISAIINHRGQILAQSEHFEQQVLNGTVYAMTGSTPFTHTGSWPIISLCLLITIIAVFRNRTS